MTNSAPKIGAVFYEKNKVTEKIVVQSTILWYNKITDRSERLVVRR